MPARRVGFVLTATLVCGWIVASLGLVWLGITFAAPDTSSTTKIARGTSGDLTLTISDDFGDAFSAVCIGAGATAALVLGTVLWAAVGRVRTTSGAVGSWIALDLVAAAVAGWVLVAASGPWVAAASTLQLVTAGTAAVLLTRTATRGPE